MDPKVVARDCHELNVQFSRVFRHDTDKKKFWSELLWLGAENLHPKDWPWVANDASWGDGMRKRVFELEGDVRLMRETLKKVASVLDAILNNRKFRPDLLEAEVIIGLALKTTAEPAGK